MVVQRLAQQAETEAAAEQQPTAAKKSKSANPAQTRAAIEEARRRVAAKREHIVVLQAQAKAQGEDNAATSDRVAALRHWLARQSRTDPQQEALQDKKTELVAQLFGLVPVFPTIQNTIRIVNFELPNEEAYAAMDPDEAAAVAGYFVKISSLMGMYLEIALPNEIGVENHRWTIRPRGVELASVSLHPRVAGVDGFKLGMKLLEQNVVRLCFEQGIAIRRGHEHEIASNLFRLVSFMDGNRRNVGLGCEGPFANRVVLPSEAEPEEKPEDGFVLV